MSEYHGRSGFKRGLGLSCAIAGSRQSSQSTEEFLKLLQQTSASKTLKSSANSKFSRIITTDRCKKGDVASTIKAKLQLSLDNHAWQQCTQVRPGKFQLNSAEEMLFHENYCNRGRSSQKQSLFSSIKELEKLYPHRGRDYRQSRAIVALIFHSRPNVSSFDIRVKKPKFERNPEIPFQTHRQPLASSGAWSWS